MLLFKEAETSTDSFAIYYRSYGRMALWVAVPKETLQFMRQTEILTSQSVLTSQSLSMDDSIFLLEGSRAF